MYENWHKTVNYDLSTLRTCYIGPIRENVKYTEATIFQFRVTSSAIVTVLFIRGLSVSENVNITTSVCAIYVAQQ